MDKKVILGLDISTSCIGVAIIIDDGINKPIIHTISHVAPKVSKKITGIEALILSKAIFEREFLDNIQDVGITDCIIESPLIHTTRNSSANTVAQLLKFNGLISEAVYNTLHIVPQYISSHDARLNAFPELIAIRKFNRKGEIYDIKHIQKDIANNHLVLFGSYPFDCDQKNIMLNVVTENYPNINWVCNKKGELIKRNYDASDALVCAIAYANISKNGEMNPSILSSTVVENESTIEINYIAQIWGKEYPKTLIIPKA